MSEFVKIKDNLIQSLWLPVIAKGGSMFYPKLRKNKQMKLLTLTNDENYKEITELKSHKITDKDLIYPWNYDSLKRIRLESEGLDNVFGSKYEDSIMAPTHIIQEHFPFDIINLDFSSQDPVEEVERLEKEIISLERTLFLQRSKGSDKPGCVLIYTTVINGQMMDCKKLKEGSNKFSMSGWSGLSLMDDQLTSDYQKKIQILENITSQLAAKYGYNVEMTKGVYEVIKDKLYICSLACILTRS